MAKNNPPIANGSYVSWNGGTGRVDLLVSNGKVPGVDDEVEGTAKSPAARVVVWENGKPTRKKIAKSTHTLRRIPPIKSGKSLEGVTLVEVLADHEDTIEALGLPEVHRVSGRQVKTVYERGLAAWPGPARTSLTREQWALGRASHFTKAATLTEPEDEEVLGNDTDLLPPDHPALPVSAGGAGEDLFSLWDDTEVPPGDEPPADEPPQPPAAPAPPSEDATETPAEPVEAVETPEDGGGEVETPEDAPGGSGEDDDEDDDPEKKVMTIDMTQIEADLARLREGYLDAP